MRKTRTQLLEVDAAYKSLVRIYKKLIQIQLEEVVEPEHRTGFIELLWLVHKATMMFYQMLYVELIDILPEEDRRWFYAQTGQD